MVVMPIAQTISNLKQTVGEITSVDDSSITVKTPDGGSKIILVSDSTTINKAAQVDKTDLKAGSKVSISGDRTLMVLLPVKVLILILPLLPPPLLLLKIKTLPVSEGFNSAINLIRLKTIFYDQQSQKYY